MASRFFLNRNVERVTKIVESLDAGPSSFHRKLPGYAPTPLIDAPEIARKLGIGAVLLKVESSRLGLPAFKILGASWAVYRALEKRLGHNLPAWNSIAEFKEQLAPFRPMTLVAATDGNHGRAVAHMAALLGFEARIYVPAGTAQARINGIASEGAKVEVIDGTYDDAVARAAQDASEHCLVISDTSWPGYEEVPRWVMEGYTTIFAEVEEELASRNKTGPDLVAVQFGVGALAAAVVRHYHTRVTLAQVVSVEPLSAACALAAMEAGEIVTVPGPHDSIMAGLNCGRVSLVAWPIISRGIDAFIAIEDERAREAMRWLAEIGVVAGETGGSGLAGMIELLTGADRAERRAALRINRETRLLVIVTEGATDPANYDRIVGTAASSR